LKSILWFVQTEKKSVIFNKPSYRDILVSDKGRLRIIYYPENLGKFCTKIFNKKITPLIEGGVSLQGNGNINKVPYLDGSNISSLNLDKIIYHTLKETDLVNIETVVVLKNKLQLPLIHSIITKARYLTIVSDDDIDDIEEAIIDEFGISVTAFNSMKDVNLNKKLVIFLPDTKPLKANNAFLVINFSGTDIICKNLISPQNIKFKPPVAIEEVCTIVGKDTKTIETLMNFFEIEYTKLHVYSVKIDK